MEKSEKPVLYMHAGSGNHGCEAIVRSLCDMLPMRLILLTNDASEDTKYSLNNRCELWEERHFTKHKIAHVMYYGYRLFTKDAESFIRYRYYKAFRGKALPLAISIGGDNYCYDMMRRDLYLANHAFNKRGTKTVLLGCSIEPELLEVKSIQDDLMEYHVIIARESITYEALLQMLEKRQDVSKGPKVILCPDPAFTLETDVNVVRSGQNGSHTTDGITIPDNTVGINISPMIQDNESEPGITMQSYEALISHILDTSAYSIALIPHVVWARNDDLVPLRKLYERFRDTGRVSLIPDMDCSKLKGVISKCRIFVGARTHATIAAYSSKVPTLVVGYSVKARGIARDLFGTDEHYVIPVQQLESPRQLIESYEWILTHASEIKEKLEQIMPSYQERAKENGKEVERLWEELS